LLKSKALVFWFVAIFGFKLYEVNKGFWKETDSIATGIVKSSPAEVLFVPFQHFPEAVKGQEMRWHWTGTL
jgi:hypothetical protein